MTDTGARVGAILSGDQHQVKFLGWGVYEGMHLRPDAEQLIESCLPAQRQINEAEARLSVADWRDWHKREHQWHVDRAGASPLSEHELELRARRSYDRAQQRLAWTDEQLADDLTGSRMMQNPRIRLDNGKVVWGMECWWGDADRVQRQLDAWRTAGAEIVEVDIDVERQAD